MALDCAAVTAAALERRDAGRRRADWGGPTGTVVSVGDPQGVLRDCPLLPGAVDADGDCVVSHVALGREGLRRHVCA